MNLHISIVLVYLCGAAYMLLMMSTKINMRALHVKFSCSCLQTHKILNTQEKLQNIRKLLTRMLKV